MPYVYPLGKFDSQITPTVMNILIDCSSSMEKFGKLGAVSNELYDVIFPVCRERPESTRIDVGTFSNGRIRNVSGSPGFHHPKKYIGLDSEIEFSSSIRYGGKKSLSSCIIRGIDYCASAVEVIQEQRQHQKVTARCIVLTDGRNETDGSILADKVFHVLYQSNQRVNMKLDFIFLDPQTNFKENHFLNIKEGSGDRMLSFLFINEMETICERRRQFRHFIEFWDLAVFKHSLGQQSLQI